MMKRLFIVGFLLLSFPQLGKTQETLSGTVKDKTTKAPIPGAIVFIDNSLVETTTDDQGNFKLENIPPGYNQLVVAHGAHKTYTGKLKGVRVINIQLTEDAYKKELLETNPAKSRQWKRYYQQFEKSFLGYSANAKLAEIKNPEVLMFEKDKGGAIWGYSVGILEVENRGLGYTIHAQLDRVEIRNKQISFTGSSFYSELSSTNSAEQDQWIKRREKTYLGSREHFLYTLKTNQLSQMGFEIYKSEFTESGSFEKQDRLNQSDVFVDGALKFDDFLRVVYTKSPAEAPYRSQSSSSVAVPNDGVGQIVRGGLQIRNIPESDLRVSYLFNRASRLVLNEQAQMRNPEYLLEYGYWNWERMAEGLPIEYHLKYIAEHR